MNEQYENGMRFRVAVCELFANFELVFDFASVLPRCKTA